MNSKPDSDQFEAIQEESVNSSFSVNFQNNRKASNQKYSRQRIDEGNVIEEEIKEEREQ